MTTQPIDIRHFSNSDLHRILAAAVHMRDALTAAHAELEDSAAVMLDAAKTMHATMSALQTPEDKLKAFAKCVELVGVVCEELEKMQAKKAS